jgi:nucleoside-diphosphate-sugar epimerase
VTDFHDRSVLVTGGTGFLGSHLVRRLATEGARVAVLARERSSEWRFADVAARVRVLHADLGDPASLDRAVGEARPDLVFHLAATASGRFAPGDAAAWRDSLRVNALGTLELLRAVAERAPSVSRIVRTGGMEEYGAGEAPFSEEHRERAASPYSAGQIAATQLSAAFCAHAGLSLTTLRPSLVYGPAQPASFFVPSLVLACLDGASFPMTTGQQATDFVWVGDVVEALSRAAVAEAAAGEIVNIGGGASVTIREMAEAVLRRSGSRGRLQFGALPHREGEARERRLSIAKAARLLGWTPVTSLEEGLDRTIAWYRANRELVRARGG